MCFILYLLPLHAIHHAAEAQHQEICSFFSLSFLNNHVSSADCSGNHAAWQEALGRAQPPWALEGTKWINLPCLEPGLPAPAGEEKRSHAPADLPGTESCARRFSAAITRWCCCIRPCKVIVCRDGLILGRNTELEMFFRCLDVWRVGRVCSDFMSLLSSLWEQDIWALAGSSEWGCVQMLFEMICSRLVPVDKQN